MHQNLTAFVVVAMALVISFVVPFLFAGNNDSTEGEDNVG